MPTVRSEIGLYRRPITALFNLALAKRRVRANEKRKFLAQVTEPQEFVNA